MLRVGIYGGAFAPIHNGHIEAAKAFINQMWLDVLFVIPTGKSPHKTMDDGASDKDRLEMCRLAFSDVEGVIVSDIELLRPGTSYSIDTLRHYADADRRLFLLCGTDMILTLGEWDGADEIFDLCYPVYARREKDEKLNKPIIEKITDYRNKYGKNIVKIDSPVIEISSSEIRRMLRCGEDASRYLHPDVLKYIKEKGLYQ